MGEEHVGEEQGPAGGQWNQLMDKCLQTDSTLMQLHTTSVWYSYRFMCLNLVDIFSFNQISDWQGINLVDFRLTRPRVNRAAYDGQLNPRI